MSLFILNSLKEQKRQSNIKELEKKLPNISFDFDKIFPKRGN